MAEGVDREQIIEQVANLAGVDPDRAARLVRAFEDTFAHPFAAKLKSLRLRDILRNKNPYLYRASGIESCEDLVRRALQDYVSASAEGYFGPFFEAVARIMSGGVKPAGGGEVDLDIRDDDVARLYVIKSGAKGFNSSSYRTAKNDLDSAERRLRQDKVRVIKKIAFAYGRRKPAFKEGVEHLASKDFWAEVTGDRDFYKKLLDVCAALAPLYTADMQAPFEDLLREAEASFCKEGKVAWDKILNLVSG